MKSTTKARTATQPPAEPTAPQQVTEQVTEQVTCGGDGWVLDGDLNEAPCPGCTDCPVVDEQPAVHEIDAPAATEPVTYQAGVLAHGLHAIAHHIGIYKLDYIRVESYPGAVDGRRVVEVVVDRFNVGDWLRTVHVDEEVREDDELVEGSQTQSAIVRRFVRLPDSGVQVSLLTIEFRAVAA